MPQYVIQDKEPNVSKQLQGIHGKVADQKGCGTCYAQSVASAIRFAEGRIVGRKSESHKTIVDRITTRHGFGGAKVGIVLDEECKRRNLHWRRVSRKDAGAALHANRAIIIVFSLSESSWTRFSDFYATHPDEVLAPGRRKLRPQYRTSTAGWSGSSHAVLVNGQCDDRKAWHCKNSWGAEFAKGGYFWLHKDFDGDIITEYYDVFWYEDELNQTERNAYARKMAASGC